MSTGGAVRCTEWGFFRRRGVKMPAVFLIVKTAAYNAVGPKGDNRYFGI